MAAITTSNSIRVKARVTEGGELLVMDTAVSSASYCPSSGSESEKSRKSKIA